MGRGSGVAGRRRRGAGRCRRPGCTTTGRRSTGRAARGRGPAPSTDQPCPPTSRGSEPPCRRASMAASRIGVAPAARDAPAGPLELDLARLEHVAHEVARARLELELLRAEGEVHRRRMPQAADGSPLASRASGRSARLGQHHDPDLGHVLDRPAQALAAQAGVLDAAVGHVVDPVGRDVVDDDAADLELAERPPARRTGRW